MKTTWQRCRVHFIRNARVHANKGRHQAVLAMIVTIFAQAPPDAAAPVNSRRWTFRRTRRQGSSQAKAGSPNFG
jgi:transposase-like protein